MRVCEQRVAEIGDPARGSQTLHRCSDQMDGAGRRRGQDRVDLLFTHEPHRSGNRRQRPGDVLVGQEQPAPEQPRVGRVALDARRPVQRIRRAAAARPDVVRAMDPGLRRRLQVVVAVEPLGVIGRENVRLDAELGEERGELQRALDAASPGRREVHGNEENLHRKR